MPASEILPLLLLTDAFLLGKAGSALGGLLRRFSRTAVIPARRPAYNPAGRFLPCHRLSVGIARA